MIKDCGLLEVCAENTLISTKNYVTIITSKIIGGFMKTGGENTSIINIYN